MNIASFIDHTALKSTTSGKDIEKLCAEAQQYRFAAVCVPPFYVADAVGWLRDSGVLTATVIGFPFGYSETDTKRSEAERALATGAQELDMVINLAAVKNGDWKTVERDIAAVLEPVNRSGALLKVIIESGVLEDQEIIQCCTICSKLGVHFVKTSTGYAERGASVAAVQLIRAHLPSGIRIKASGGIRDFQFAKALVAAGATRIGCSASVAIVSEALSSGG